MEYKEYKVGQILFSFKRGRFFKIVDVSVPPKKNERLYRCFYPESGEYAQYYESRLASEMGHFPNGSLAPIIYG